MNEPDLISRSQNGDVAVFETLVRRYDQQVLGFVLSVLKNTEDAQDAFQEIFLKAFQALPHFRRESRFSTWLYRIAYNTCVSFLRRQKRGEKVSSLDEMGEAVASARFVSRNGWNPEEGVLKREFEGLVHKAVANLSPRRQAIFALRYQNDLSLQEISTVTGLSLGAVKNHLFQIHRKLRVSLQSYREA